MPQSNQTGEFNTFVGGLVTEASPLTFPENASLDEVNFVLNRDGSRQRRLGMDYESGLTPGLISYNQDPTESPITSSFTWKDVAGIAKKNFIVCQIHDKLFIFDRADSSLESTSYIKRELILFNAVPLVPKVSFASVAGMLIVATGQETIKVVQYDVETDGFTVDDKRLLTRDLFGIEATAEVSGDTVSLLDPEYINFRPESTGDIPYTEIKQGDDFFDRADGVVLWKLYNFPFGLQGDVEVRVNGVLLNFGTDWIAPVTNTIYVDPAVVSDGDTIQFTDTGNLVADLDFHVYNLRNQGWAIPRLEYNDETAKTDAITQFEFDGVTNRGLPSNADTVVRNLYPNPLAIDKNTERFDDTSAYRNEPARYRVPLGHFIIDVLERGASREAAIANMSDVYATANNGAPVNFRTPTVDLPQDKTPTGASVAAEFGGRMFYAGFSNEVIDGDDFSPRLGSYIFYTQQIKNKAQVNRCYQEGDPTDVEAPDLLDTDGGYIILDGAFNIQKMIDVGNSLMVVAENGVWAVGGTDSGTFTANNQAVTKVTEHGTIAPDSVVLVDGTIMYWSDDAIYHIVRNQVGQWSESELSINILTYYQNIESTAKAFCSGLYDSYDRKVRWLYNNLTDSTDDPRELVFDLDLGAFYPSRISRSRIGNDPLPVAIIEIPPFNSSEEVFNVVAGTDNVVADLDNVAATVELPSSGFKETAYLTLVNSGDASNTSVTFSTYNEGSFLDWVTDGTGMDAAAYMVSGYVGTGDLHRQKQVPYIYFHFLRTETGFEDNGDDLTPIGESSCIVQAQWDWSNSPAYGKWGREFQAYRYRRNYMPEDVNDPFDYGTLTIVSRNKLRGRGRVVSFYLRSEPGKDLNLLGWSMGIGTNARA